MKYRPVVLIVLDGFGIAPLHPGNAVALSRKPVFDNLVRSYPHAIIHASGEEVGLPKFEVGNSEVGHMNLGSGRVMYQELPKIDKTIQDSSFFKKEAIQGAFNHVKENNSALHFLGLVSPGGVHSHVRHLYALLLQAKKEGIKNVFIHAFTDGRDAPRQSAIDFIAELSDQIKKIGIGKIATICGRFYAMDRDKRWPRVEEAYNAIVLGQGKKSKNALEAIKASYREKIYDEELKPIVLVENGKLVAQIKENDAAIFFNFRSDRAKQLTRALTSPSFDGFKKELIPNLFFVTMTEYDKGLPVKVVFPTEKTKNILGEAISRAGLKQLRIAETEKYAHVTVFFNCGRIDHFPGEDRILVPSPQVSSYDKKPEMSAHIITEKLLQQLLQNKYDFILINFANPDMVGHTGVIPAAIKGIEAVDMCLGKIINQVLRLGGACIVTADHGNADVMINLITGEVDKEHTTNPVPFIVVSRDREKYTKEEGPMGPGGEVDLSLISPMGVLSDVSTSILDLLGIIKPKEMTGVSLLDYI
jgi:2,3-bisphosphoglycerate-independent phosphoglycerate mutase